MADIHLTLIGLNRTGMSLGLALRKYQEKGDAVHRFTITGYDADKHTCKEAKKRGMVDHCARSPEAASEEADIVLLDVPFPAQKETLEKIGPVLKGGCVVMETSPLKQPAVEWAQHYLPESAHLVGITFVLGPESLYAMPGDDEYTHAGLFERGSICIAAASDCAPEAVQLATDLGSLVGLEAHYMGPAEHDGLMAATYGLPVLLALALLNTASTSQSWLDIRRLTNPAFAFGAAPLNDTPEALFEFLAQNRQNTLHSLNQAIEYLDTLRETLRHTEEDAALAESIHETTNTYREWEYQRYTGQWSEKAKADMPSLSSGGFLGLGTLFGRKQSGDERA